MVAAIGVMEDDMDVVQLVLKTVQPIQNGLQVLPAVLTTALSAVTVMATTSTYFKPFS